MTNTALFGKLRECHTGFGKWSYKNYEKHGEVWSSEKTHRLWEITPA